MPPPDVPRRVLVVRLSHLGDIAQTIPLVHALRDAWPRAAFGWAVQPEFAALVAPLARPFAFDRRGGVGAWRALGRELGAWGPDLVVDAQGNWKSAVAARLAGRRARSVAFARAEWQEPLAARAIRPEHAPPADGPHLVARALGLARHLVGGELEPRLDPALDERERTAGDALLGDLGEAPVLLHPGVPRDPRSWPASRFHLLGRELARDGRSVLCLTGPGEAAVGAELRASLPEAAHLVGQRGLRELAALFEAARARGGRLVTGDSGPAHVAASVGLPVVLLAGPEDPSRTGPWPVAGTRDSPHRVARAPWTRRAIDEVRIQDVLDALGPA